jgi:hypothetical protein
MKNKHKVGDIVTLPFKGKTDWKHIKNHEGIIIDILSIKDFDTDKNDDCYQIEYLDENPIWLKILANPGKFIPPNITTSGMNAMGYFKCSQIDRLNKA